MKLDRHVNVRVRYLDRDGVAREEVKRGLTAGTFQHEVDHLDGILFVDRADPRTLTTWEQFERFHRDDFSSGSRSSWSGSGRDGLLVRAGVAWRRAAPSLGCWSSVDGERFASVEAGVAEPPPARRACEA